MVNYVPRVVPRVCAFAAVAVEFAVEDLFPGAEVEFAVGDCDDDFAAYDLAFEVGVGVVFAGSVVVVLGGGGLGASFSSQTS